MGLEIRKFVNYSELVHIEGFKKARFKSIIVMDGDLQHKPSDIKKILIL